MIQQMERFPRKIPRKRVLILLAVAVCLGVAETANLYFNLSLQKLAMSVLNNGNELARTSDEHHPTAAEQAFANKYCDTHGVSWFPTEQDGAWQQRAPYFLQIGAKKAGTTSLAHYLSLHPSIVAPRHKELLFFQPPQTRLKKTFNFTSDNGKTLVASARADLYNASQREYFYMDKLQTNASLISYDATPDLVFYADMISHILCTCPWVKLLLILRDPVERLWSHYRFMRAVMGSRMTKSFEDYIAMDGRRLRDAGVIPSASIAANMTDRELVEMAESHWENYTRHALFEATVGRGMYIVQIHHWFHRLREMGRNPADYFLIVRSQDLDQNRQAVVDRVFEFLELDPFTLPYKKSDQMTTARLAAERLEKEKTDEWNSIQMDPKTRQRLEFFCAPYNRQLHDLLGIDFESRDGIVTWPPANTSR